MTKDMSLDDLIDNAYRLFAAYPAPGELLACTHCMVVAEQEQARALAVRNIPAELFWRYHHAAYMGRTPLQEVKHFLPRYLDLISRFQEEGALCLETALTRLPRIDYKEGGALTYSRLDPGEWKPEEFSLLHAWARTFFSHCLSQYHDYKLFPGAPPIEAIDDILIMFAHGGFDLSPLLCLWEEDHRLTALLHAKDLLLWGFNEAGTAMENPFAEDDPELCATLMNWLRTAKVRARFRQGCETALARQAPVLDMAHGFHAGRTHREELKIMRQRL
ncbi:MAG: hypothetical protein LBF93_08470 [Zoogloeaceae bacterium]|nr:hypothetical protein [Zoogloeaceae bacterium]